MNFEEKTVNSEIIFEGKVVTVLKDDVELSDGTTGYREVVKHNGGVVVLALHDDKILLVKQFRYPIRKVMFELPAGKLERGEDPFEAAKRELEEETGYCANKWTDLGAVYTSPGYSNEKLYLYKAEDLEFTHCHPDEGEIIQAFEYSVQDVMNMIYNGEIEDAKTLCAILRGLKNND